MSWSPLTEWRVGGNLGENFGERCRRLVWSLIAWVYSWRYFWLGMKQPQLGSKVRYLDLTWVITNHAWSAGMTIERGQSRIEGVSREHVQQVRTPAEFIRRGRFLRRWWTGCWAGIWVMYRLNGKPWTDGRGPL